MQLTFAKERSWSHPGWLDTNACVNEAQCFVNRTFLDNEALLAKVCEIGRRNKIMNPDKMRTTYGKLMWLLQDSVKPEVPISLKGVESS